MMGLMSRIAPSNYFVSVTFIAEVETEAAITFPIFAPNIHSFHEGMFITSEILTKLVSSCIRHKQYVYGTPRQRE